MNKIPPSDMRYYLKIFLIKLLKKTSRNGKDTQKLIKILKDYITLMKDFDKDTLFHDLETLLISYTLQQTVDNIENQYYIGFHYDFWIEVIYQLLRIFPKKAIDLVSYIFKHSNIRVKKKGFEKIIEVFSEDLKKRLNIKNNITLFFLSHYKLFSTFRSNFSFPFQKQVITFIRSNPTFIKFGVIDWNDLELKDIFFYSRLYQKTINKAKKTTLEEIQKQPIHPFSWLIMNDRTTKKMDYVYYYKRKYRNHFFYYRFNYTLLRFIISYLQLNNYTISLRKTDQTILIDLDTPELTFFIYAEECDEYFRKDKSIKDLICPEIIEKNLS